ncbi:MAG: cyclase family protein [Bacilli bacterium]
MKIFDITIPMQTSLATWPGDTAFKFQLNWKKTEGASVNVGMLMTSVHSGTHADAPFHFLDDGVTIDAIDLQTYIGPAMVIDVSGRGTITIEDFKGIDLSRTPRVLFKTNSWLDHSTFPTTIAVMSEDVPAFLKDQGVVLIGLDVPSVDLLDSKDLIIHQLLAANHIHILESLLLEKIPQGVYELIALPLKIVGGDGAPVRAILRK